MPQKKISISFPALQLWAVLTLAISFASGLPAKETPSPPAELAGALYLDAWQIEKEFVVSPLALQQWLDLGITADSRLSPEERAALKPRIGNFLAQKCPVTIQGEPIEFTLDRIHFIEPKATEFSLIDPKATVSPQDIRISAVYAAPNMDLRQALQVFWNLIPENAPFVTVKVADAGGTRSFNLTKFNPALNIRGRYRSAGRNAPPPPPALPALDGNVISLPWLTVLIGLGLVPPVIRFLCSERKNPALAVLLILLAVAAASLRHIKVEIGKASGTELSETQSSRILDPLLRGVYHSFHYRKRSEQYDALSKVVGGAALTPIFLEVQRTLESRARDGSRVRVNDLRIEDSQPSPLPDRPGFTAACNWEVSGRVGHWGHFHDRTNLYRATFVVEPLQDSWKITQLSLHEREREPEPASASTSTPD